MIRGERGGNALTPPFLAGKPQTAGFLAAQDGF